MATNPSDEAPENKYTVAHPYCISEEEYYDHCDSDDGLCLACGEIREGSTEPDAEGYECEECGAHKVMGFEQAMICGFIEVDS
jgi:hypothetical protein